MDTFLTVLILAALPAGGNLLGGLLSELFRLSYRTLSLALHAAAGILFAVIGMELMPTALTAEPPWLVVVAFILGGGAFLLIESAVHGLQHRLEGVSGSSEANSGAWGIYLATALDLFSDGLMIGTGATISFELGLLLALGQISADIPEGFATIATFRNAGVLLKRRLLLAVSFILPVFIGAALGFFLVREQPVIVKYSLLALTAGILLTTVVEEVIPQAHKEEDAYISVLALVGGFALFSLVTVYLGA